MATDWGREESSTNALTRLTNLIDEAASSTPDDEELRVTKDSTDASNIARYTSQFDDLNTVMRKPVINIQSSQGLSSFRDVIITENGGSVDSLKSQGEIKVSTDSQSNSFANIETGKWGQYTPGYEAQIGLGARLPQQPTDDGNIRWGYFNGDDGFYFGYDSDGIYVGVERDGTEIRKAYRENWNGREPNNLDGVSFEPNEGAIYQINFAWYGYGSIQFSIVSSDPNTEQQNVVVHTFAIDGETSITNPNQPVRMSIDSGASGNAIEAYVGGRQFSTLGEVTDDFRITSDVVTDVSVDNGSWTYVTSFRRKQNSSRRVNLVIDSFEANAADDARFALVLNPNISGTNYGSFELIPSDETVAEVSTTGTFDGIGDGVKAIETFIPVGQNAKGAVGEPIRELNKVIPRNQPLVLLAQGAGTSTTVDATLRIRESW